MPKLAKFQIALVLVAAILLGGCATLPPPVPGPPAYALTDVADTHLGRLAANAAPAGQGGLSGFRLLPEAAFAFDARISLARHARKSLDVQYYLIQNDEVGLFFLRELRDAAARGVRVRLLMDDLYTGGEDELLLALAAHPNVEVRLFNPLPSRADSPAARVLFSLHDFSRINHRMHNKLMVADNSFAVSGGRNIASEYFMRGSAANFIDVDVLSCGPIVHGMSEAFDRYWNSEQVRPVGNVVAGAMSAEAARGRFDALSRAALPDVPLRPRDVMGRGAVGQQLETGALELYWATSELFVDDPRKITRGADARRGSVTEGALGVLATARRDAMIASPYFIPGERGMAMMRTAMAQGGRAEIVTNSLGATDEPLVHARYARYRADMLRIGVTIREIAPTLAGKSGRFGDFGQSISRLHAKLMVIDGQRMFIGSMNLDPRSAAVNTELGLVINSPELVADFEKLLSSVRANTAYRLRLSPDSGHVQWLEYDADGKDIVHDDEPGGHHWLRLQNWLLSPLVGEDLL
ncbi:phospholipase D family protein [Variovorax paradoxus]|nr:phospholipase D family protein [Variovorax paradoxus]